MSSSMFSKVVSNYRDKRYKWYNITIGASTLIENTAGTESLLLDKIIYKLIFVNYYFYIVHYEIVHELIAHYT